MEKENGITMKKAVGIDLGTTNCEVTYYVVPEGESIGAPVAVPIEEAVLVPSCLYLSDGKYTVGRKAYDKRWQANAAYSAKRYLGTDKEFELVDDVTNEKVVLAPQDVSRLVLEHIRLQAKATLGNVDEVTVTVPAMFTPTQKKLTHDAAISAGFTTVHVLQEPVAAALAYQVDSTKEEKLIIFDLGGGTFDVSVLQLTPGSPAVATKSEVDVNPIDTFFGVDDVISTASRHSTGSVRVLYTDGDRELGGDDVDKNILRKVIFNATRANTLPDLTPVQTEFLTLKIEGLKKTNNPGSIPIPGTDMRLSVTQEDIRSGYRQVLNKTKPHLHEVINNFPDYSRVVLVGGSTKSVYVTEFLREVLGDVVISSELNPDEAVGLGAAVNSAIKLDVANVSFIDIINENIGIETIDGTIKTIIPKGSMLPATGREVFHLARSTDAVLKIHSSTKAIADISTYVSHLVLTPEDTSAEIVVELSVSLDNILSAKITCGDQRLDKEIVNMKTMAKKEDDYTNKHSISDRKVKRQKRVLNTLVEDLKNNKQLKLCFMDLAGKTKVSNIDKTISELEGIRDDINQMDSMESVHGALLKNKNILDKYTKLYADALESLGEAKAGFDASSEENDHFDEQNSRLTSKGESGNAKVISINRSKSFGN